MTLWGRVCVIATLASLAASTLSAQDENLDALFSDPAADTVVTETQTDHLAQYVTSDKLAFSGYFYAKGGIGAGWTTWPIVPDLASGFDASIGLTSTANLYFDARPDPDFRFYGYVTTTMDPLSGAYTWSNFSIGELFVDYIVLDRVFIRMGKHDIAWGQARLFEGITDIMSDAVNGYSLRANVPTVLSGLSIIGMINRPGASSFWQIAYAAKVDEVLWGTMLSLGARYQIDEGLNALMSVKRVLWGVDLLADVVLHYDSASLYPRVLSGFYKEWPDVRLYGEYYFDGSIAGVVDHTVGLVCGFNNIAGTVLDLGFQWLHAFIDNSGSVTAGLAWKPWKFLTATIALPVAYGSDGSRYVTAYNEDISKRRIALVFGLVMEVSF